MSDFKINELHMGTQFGGRDKPPEKKLSELELSTVVEKCDPKNTPWRDITDPFNDDGQNAIEQGWITPEGGLTNKGYIQLHGTPKNDGLSRQIDVSTTQPLQTGLERTTKFRPDNRLINLEQAAKKQLQAIISKYGYETSLRKTDTGGYILNIVGRRGGNNRPEMVHTAKGVSPLDCYEKVLDYFSEEVATKHNS